MNIHHVATGCIPKVAKNNLYTPERAFRYYEGAPNLEELLPLDEPFNAYHVSQGYDINDIEAVVGISNGYPGYGSGPQRACYWPSSSQEAVALSVPEETAYSAAMGINNPPGNLVVGYIAGDYGSGFVQQAVLWNGSGSAIDLNDRIVEGFCGVELETALDINDQGLIVGSGEFTSSGWPAHFVLVPTAAAGAPYIMTAVSRKTHSDGFEFLKDFDIPLPVSGPNLGVECRLGGPSRLILVFSESIHPADGTWSANEVQISVGQVDTYSLDCNIMTIDISGVPNETCLTLALDGIVDATGNPLVDLDIQILSLYCDISGSGAVNSTDIGMVKSQSGQPVTAGNFRNDVNANGQINSADIGQVKAQSGTSASCSP